MTIQESSAEELEHTREQQELYKWMPTDHAPKCPKHRNANQVWLRDIARKLFDIPEEQELHPNHIAKIPCLKAEGCCPQDIVVVAGEAPVIIGTDSQNGTLRQGDRVRGAYYADLIKKTTITGLALLADVDSDHAKHIQEVRKKRLRGHPDYLSKANEDRRHASTANDLYDKLVKIVEEPDEASKG